MRNMRSKASQQNKLLKIVTIPVRALCKARDSYVKGMTNYANRMHYGNSNAMGVQGVEKVHVLPKSYTVNSIRTNNKNEEYRELIQSASARYRQQMNMRSDSLGRQQPKPQPQPKGMPPRSRSVALGRIDEDSPCCYFGDQDNVINENNVFSVKNDLKLARSRSHSVTRKAF